MKNLWLSIHPRWIVEILGGRKSVELRRRAPSVQTGANVLLYSTSPESSVVGQAKVVGILQLPLETLWTRHGKSAGVTKQEFLDYFEGCETGVAIVLDSVAQLERPIGLAAIREAGFEPAQGWRYLHGDATSRLLDARPALV